LITFDVILVHVERSFITTKTSHDYHNTKKNISNKIIILKPSNMVFGSFDCDYAHGRNTCKNKKILIFKYSSCSKFNTNSRGIVVVAKETSEWQTYRTLV
jgi:hypothetical protein